MKLIVGVTGASGIPIARRFLEVAKQMKFETHLVVSKDAETVIKYELKKNDLTKFANFVYAHDDFEASIASGSFPVDAMIVVPCSMRSLGAIANGMAFDLITRAADISLKQERPLILVIRETPLNLIHLRNMVHAREAGATILPPMLAFYNEPRTLEDTIDFVVGKIMDSLKVDNKLYKRWKS